MAHEPISDTWVRKLNGMFPPNLQFLRSASIDYAPCRIAAREGVRTREEFPVAALSGEFSGMRSSGVTAQPLDHLSGFHIPYMLPQLCYAGLAHMAIIGKVQGIESLKLEEICDRQKEFLVAQNDSRFFSEQVPIRDDSVIYGTVYLLDHLKVRPNFPGCPAKVYYTMGPSPNSASVTGWGGFFLNLRAPIVNR